MHYWYRKYPGDRLIVLDALTYAGNLNSLVALKDHTNFRFVQGDICNSALIEHLLAEEAIDIIAHFAAESHVDRSILGPAAFVQTNVVGTFTLLEEFRKYWSRRGCPEGDRFLHISTDEVYGSLADDEAAFSETTPYAPNSPYSASKAGSDHLVRAYFHTYGLPTLITHCANNYGPYQFPEKLIPLMFINILMGKPLPIYGDGQHIRDWLYVGDHCSAIDQIIHHSDPGETYNIGGNNEVKNINLVTMICDLMDELAPDLPVRPTKELISFVKDRPGHDRRYAINATKIQTELGWMPSMPISEGLRSTIQWYLANPDWWQPLLATA